MKPKTILKHLEIAIGILTILVSVNGMGYAMVADDKGAPPMDERNLGMPGREEAQESQYAPGEVLVKFKKGTDPSSILKKAGVEAREINRIHSIKPAIAKFKKDYKLEKDLKGGWYSFLGKQYKEVEEIPDEEMFKEAYANMPETEKALYRSYKVELPEGVSVEEAVARLKDDPNVEYAQPNYKNEPYMVPDDSYYSTSGSWGQTYPDLWGLKPDKLNCEAAWDISQGEGVVVAVIDTGVDYNHEDISQNIYRDANGNIIGYDFSDNDNDPLDYHGHGTHVAGTIAAVGNNTKGIIGVAPKAKIMPVKIFPNAYDDVCAQAIRYAADNGANVLSNSWGPRNRRPSDPAIEEAIDYAYEKNEDEIPSNGIDDDQDGFIDNVRGCVIVFAAGNNNDDVAYYSPANYLKTIAVAATDNADAKASFSNRGNLIDVAAPGVEILSLRAQGTDMYLGASGYSPGTRFVPAFDETAKYYRANGTSMACPHVSGVVALMLSKIPSLTNKEVLAMIEMSADDIGQPGRDDFFGYGRINAYNACISARVCVSIDSPTNKSYIWGSSVDIYGDAIISDNQFQQYELYYISKDNPQVINTITPQPVTTPVENGLLASWNTTDLTKYHEGKGAVVLKIVNTTGREITRSIDVTIDNYNEPPQFVNLSNKATAVGKLSEFKVEGVDPDDPNTPFGQLQYAASNLPPGATFNPQTQIFSWQRPEGDKQEHKNVTFSISDSEYTSTNSIDLIPMEETCISGNGKFNPKIHGDKIVYQELYWVWDGTTWTTYCNLYIYDIKTGQESKITDDHYERDQIDFDGTTIVWQDKRNRDSSNPNNLDIFSYNLNTGQQSQITFDPGLQCWPSVYGQKIVWEDYRNGAYNSDIYMYDMNTFQETRITGNQAAQRIPSIYNNIIVWNDYRDPSGIYMYDISTQIERQVTQKSVYTLYTAINENKFVWSDYRNGNEDIYMYDLSTNQERQITPDLYYQRAPDVYGDKIVWQDGRNTTDDNPANADIYMYDISDGREIQITFDPYFQYYPSIYGNNIVWMDQRDGMSIHMAKLFFPPKITAINPTLLPIRSVFTIEGSNFGDSQDQGSKVVFANGVEAQVQQWSHTKITCIVPEGAVSGLLKVVTSDNESNGYAVTVGTPPFLSPIGNQTVDEGTLLTFIISATDPEGDALSYSGSNLPTGGILADNHDNTATFTWVPTYEQAGTYENVTLAVTDTGGFMDSEDITITVNNVNRPPDVSGIPSALTKDEGSTITNSEIELAIDPDGGTLTYTYSGWTTTMPYTIGYDQSGPHALHVEVSDGTTSIGKDITITINNVNRSPILDTIGNKATDENQKLEFTISGSDPDGGTLTYSASNLPLNSTFNATIRIFTWTPSYTQAGTYNNVHFEVTDGSSTDSEDITITVNNTNRPPDISAIPSSLTRDEGATISRAEIELAIDPDGGTLTYTYSGWTTALPYTIGYNQAGTHTLHVDVSDGAATAGKDITITVNNVTGPFNWHSSVSNPNQAIWAQAVSHWGSKSLRLSNSVVDYSYWYGDTINFTAPYPKTFLLSGWAKGQNITSGSWVPMYYDVVFEDNTSNSYYIADLIFPTGSYAWKKKSLTYTFNKGVKSIRPYLQLYGKGTVWFDDIYIGVTSPNLVLNPGMEQGS